jgi:hypothetical protein
MRIESAGTAESYGHGGPPVDDSLAAMLLPATIALCNHAGRGSNRWMPGMRRLSSVPLYAFFLR